MLMKKIYTIAMLAIASLTANAQSSLILSTYKGTDLAKYNNQVMNVTASRYVFNNWNTISLPFALSSVQLDEIFGSDCKLEKLVGVEKDATGAIKLNFQDCKSAGIQPNIPYILYYSGEKGNKKIQVEGATIIDAPATITFAVEGSDETVTMSCAKLQKDAKGLYGVLAKDNSEAAFVNVDNVENGFYATRCFVQLKNGNSTLLTTNHIGDASDISQIAKADELVDVYNISGCLVASKVKAADVNNLQKGVYVVKNKKIMVK